MYTFGYYHLFYIMMSLSDNLRAQKLKDKSLNLDMIDDALQQTGQDFVDLGLNELKKFTPASRITKADKENNTKSTHRKLDQLLVLLLNEKLGLYSFHLVVIDQKLYRVLEKKEPLAISRAGVLNLWYLCIPTVACTVLGRMQLNSYSS